jgi:hypothetical protein
MGILQKIFGAFSSKSPESFYEVKVTNESVTVSHPKHGIEKINWNKINLIKLINTDAGPAGIDIWLNLKGDNEECFIPHGHKGFDQVYEIVSQYDNFNFNNFINSMSCADNKAFLLWEK